MSEPKGRGSDWTEERGTSDEGMSCLETGPEASECTSEYCITCSDMAVEVRIVRLLEDQMAVVEGGAGEETVSVALVSAGVGDTILVHAREAIAVVAGGGP